MRKPPKQFTLTPKRRWKTLADCPVGMFMSEWNTLCMKTEYGNNEGRIDAYIVESGEFFWGGTSKPEDQRGVYVMPLVLTINR